METEETQLGTLSDYFDHKNYTEALLESYDFYHYDVEPRRKRERSLIQRFIYGNPFPIELAKIGVILHMQSMEVN